MKVSDSTSDNVCAFHISIYAFLICVILVLAVLIGREVV